MFAGQLARAIVALFTGAAVYISSPLVEWNLAYRRGYMMQASLAIAGGFFGGVAFFSNLRVALAARSVLLVNSPYSIFVIIPIYHRMMNPPPGAATGETRRMIVRWGILQAGRCALGLVT